MMFSRKKGDRYALLSVAILLIFLYMSGFAVVHSVDANGTMTNCPTMMSDASFCEGSVFHHITVWQGALLASNPLLFVVFGILFLDFIYSLALFLKGGRAFPSLRSRELYQSWHSFKSFFASPILYAFSQGNIHPILYA
jgi:hypothetical protein